MATPYTVFWYVIEAMQQNVNEIGWLQTLKNVK
jgi:hypothetical protein